MGNVWLLVNFVCLTLLLPSECKTEKRLFDDHNTNGLKLFSDTSSNSSTSEQNSPIYSMSWDDFVHTVLVDNIATQCRYNSADYTQLSLFPKLSFEVNWQDFGAVQQVRDQGACKSPWAFAAVSATEAHAFIQSGELYRVFSVQQLLDCMGTGNRMACGAGSSGLAFNYLQKQGGLALDMLYTNKSLKKNDIDAFSTCKFSSTTRGMQVGGGSKDIKPFDEATLISALLNIGPVTVMIDGRGLKSYHGGIWDGTYTDDQGNSAKCSSDSSQLNHAVLIVGVETDLASGTVFYTVLNSWGSGWGESGFFRLLRAQNICGISVCASYPRLQPF